MAAVDIVKWSWGEIEKQWNEPRCKVHQTVSCPTVQGAVSPQLCTSLFNMSVWCFVSCFQRYDVTACSTGPVGTMHRYRWEKCSLWSFISNYINYKIWDWITYPFPNVNCSIGLLSYTKLMLLCILFGNVFVLVPFLYVGYVDNCL